MAKSFNQKIKLLILMNLFNERTDEDHPLSMHDILEELEKNEIHAARKSVYDDIRTLIDAGMDICYKKEKPDGYYLASHTFELAELKLLVDAVQASKFITEKKSRALIGKIEGLTSKYEASHLQRQVFVADRVKTMNESIYYNVDHIHTAIGENVQIEFRYMKWALDGKLELKNNGKLYKISPWALTWREENYYLIGYDSVESKIKHFRVDKMNHIELTKTPRDGKETFGRFDLAGYLGKTFGMFSGEEEVLRIRFPMSLIGVVADRFGEKASIRKENDDFFIARIHIAVSGQFFGWLTGLGKGITIEAPESVKTEYKEYLRGILDAYDH